MLATRGGSRTPRLYHNTDRSVGWADQCSLLNPRFGPAMATRGGWTSTLSTITRGVRHHVHTLDDHPRGWHTNRVSWRAILVSHLAISCRDPKRLRAVFELRHEEGADHNRLTNLSARPSGAVFELRHEEGADQNHNPVRGARQGHRRFFKRTSTLTPG